MKPNRLFSLLALLVLPAAALQAWDYEGHRIVNQLALASVKNTDFPAFVFEPANAERVAFLAGEADRWRNVPDLPLKQSGSWEDHFLDIEQLPWAGLDPAKVSSFRYDFLVTFAAARAAHAAAFAEIDAKKNTDHTREWPGTAPWAITENYEKLKSAFSYLKVFQELGTPEEVANAQANVVYVMGVLGHFVGDCAQPLHVTVHHAGWVGPNPNGYTTWSGFHPWIDGGLISKAGITTAKLAPRVTPAQAWVLTPQADARDPMFVQVMDYLIATQQLVEPLYQLEKAGKLGDEAAKTHQEGPDTQPVSAEGQAFIEAQLLRGGETLGAIWLTAWRTAPPDTYLRSVLLKRHGAVVPVVPAPVAATEYWASSKSSKHVYHLPSCEWAQKIKPGNKVVFASKAEAEAQGYKPCGTCKP